MGKLLIRLCKKCGKEHVEPSSFCSQLCFDHWVLDQYRAALELILDMEFGLLKNANSRPS